MTVIGKLEQSMAAGGAVLPKVIWLNGANCTGCTVSLANLFSDSGPTDIADLLLNTIDLAFHPTLMGAAGDLAVKQLKDTAQGNYILAVDGGIPTAFNGHTCLLWTDEGKEVTAMEAVQMLAPNADAVLSIGTCASYGGMPAADPNPTGIVSVSELTGINTVNIPGCPTHPDWIVWTIAHLLTGEMPQLDDRSRPTALYGSKLHENCPRKEYDEIKTFGVENRCLKALGCKGPETKSDCPSRKWNNGTNWCIGAGAICIGCTERDFPDQFSPFYKLEYEYKQFDKSGPEDPSTDPENGPLSFTRAEWEAENVRLRAEGKGLSGQIVTISDADSGIQLGAVSVDSTGDWRFIQSNPSSVPLRLSASSAGQTIFSDVANAPVDPPEPPPADDAFEVNKVEWNSRRQQLKIEGKGTAGTVVSIYNASTNNKLAKVETNSRGKWKWSIRRPVTVPCTVRVVYQNTSVNQAVQNAPGGCV